MLDAACPGQVFSAPTPDQMEAASNHVHSGKGILFIVKNYSGVGLAANQVGYLQRVVVIEIPEDEKVYVLINPEITRRQGERVVEEGCLSIPGYRGELSRSLKVRVRALDRNGETIKIKAEGLLAQALEHETDHINGTLYIDHLQDADQLWRIVHHHVDSEAEAS